MLKYSMLSCPNFNRKKVSYYGFLYYVPFNDFISLVENSNGVYMNYYLDEDIDYVILNEDVYYKFMNKHFKKYDELYYIYWNTVKSSTIVISEFQMLQLCKCDISKVGRSPIKYIGNNTFYPQDDYIVTSIITTGWDCYYDQPYQIGALKVKDGRIADTFLFNIQSMGRYDKVLNSMYSISKEFFGTTKVIEEVSLRYKDFIENLPIVSCNTYLKHRFLFYQYYNTTMKYVDNPYIDILKLANNLSIECTNLSLKSIMKSLNLSLLSNKSSSLTWCMSMLNCYETLKNMLDKESIKSFVYNPFLNRDFVFEGIFKKFSRKTVKKLIVSLGGKISNKVSINTSFLVLSNYCYYDYLNDNKSDKDIQAQSLIEHGSDLKIISENVMYNIIQNYEDENHIKVL